MEVSRERILAQHLEAARAAWPGIALDGDAFRAELDRLCEDRDALETVRAADVYLARACAAGDSLAIVAFERTYFGEVDAMAARLGADLDSADEVKQSLRRALFVPDGERPAALTEFAGRGDLRGWIRVSAVRAILRVLRRARRIGGAGEDGLLDLLSPARDPDLGAAQALLGGAFRAALAAAPARELALLRYHIVDGMSVEDIGSIYGVHRATAERWLARARQGILDRARAGLDGAAPGEVDGWIRLVQARLDVSAERPLR